MRPSNSIDYIGPKKDESNFDSSIKHQDFQIELFMNKALLILLLAIISLSTHAEIYKWKDKNGNVHFSDKASSQAPSEKIHLKINTYTSVTYQTVSRAMASDKAVASNAVEIYGTKWCGYCKKARSYFNLRNIHYTDYDIEADANALAKFNNFGGGGVPVIFVGNTRINGFDESTFDSFYNRK